VSRTIDGWAALGLALLSVSGLVLWWRTRIFTVRKGATGRRLLFDLHNTLGGYAWAVLFLLGLTGAMTHWESLTASALVGPEGRMRSPKTNPGCTPGASQLSPATLLDKASAFAPEARATILMLQAPAAPARVQLKYPEDHTPVGRTIVYLDRCSGAVLDATLTRQASTGYKVATMWTREIHTGDLFGWPTRVIVVAASLVLPLMAITGPWLWIARRRRRARSATAVSDVEGSEDEDDPRSPSAVVPIP
jgi:uncharacterized iron-regulated membrane protein